MKKLAIAVALSFSFALPAMAEGDLAKNYLGESVKLTKSEKAAIGLSDEWKAGKPGTEPFVGPAGVVRFIYGIQKVSVVCAPLQICDLALQPGEQVNNVILGDTYRWQAVPAVTGFGEDRVEHVIIKPLDAGIETTMIITTDRRAYNIHLRAHRTEYMAVVGFTYPEVAEQKWNAIRQEKANQVQAETLPGTQLTVGKLDFDYSLKGSAPWMPIRVFNNGVKTTIQLPKDVSAGEVPALFVVRSDGGLFSEEETQIVNYRVLDDRIIVDGVFDKFILVSGVGDTQDKVTITRQEPVT